MRRSATFPKNLRERAERSDPSQARLEAGSVSDPGRGAERLPLRWEGEHDDRSAIIANPMNSIPSVHGNPPSKTLDLSGMRLTLS